MKVISLWADEPKARGKNYPDLAFPLWEGTGWSHEKATRNRWLLRGVPLLPAVSCCCGLQAGRQKLQGSIIIIKTFLEVVSVSSFVFPCWSSFGLRLGIPNQEESCFTLMVQFTELLKSCFHLNILLAKALSFIQQLLRVFLLPPWRQP